MSTIQVPTSAEANGNGRQAGGSRPPDHPTGPMASRSEAVERVYVEVAEGIRVPVRKINLTAGEPVLSLRHGRPAGSRHP